MKFGKEDFSGKNLIFRKVNNYVNIRNNSQVQGKDPSVDITQDFVEESEDERFEDMSDTAPPVELPPCEINKLETINEVRFFFLNFLETFY